MLDAEKVIQRLLYFYTNPQRVRLVNSIEEYPNLSTWNVFLSAGSVKRLIPTFPRTAIPTIDEQGETGHAGQICSLILAEKKGEAELVIEPFAWLECFPDTVDHPPDSVIEQVVSQVRSTEFLIRREKGENVLGARTLRVQSIRRQHNPKEKGRRMICLGSCRVKRRELLRWFLEEARHAGAAIRRWIEEKIPLSLPAGRSHELCRTLVLSCALFALNTQPQLRGEYSR